MNLRLFLISVFVAASFMAWPNASKALKVSGGLVGTVVVSVTLIVMLATSYKDIIQLRDIPLKALIGILVVSFANGLAVYVYAGKAADPAVSTSALLVTIILLEMICSPLFDWFITKAAPTWQQLVGMCLVAPGIWLIAMCGRR